MRRQSATIRQLPLKGLLEEEEEMLNTMNWQTLQERRLRTRLIMFHKVITENIAIPTQNMNCLQHVIFYIYTGKLELVSIQNRPLMIDMR